MNNCNIGAALHKAAAERKDAVALVTGKNGKYQQWTFQEVLANSNRYANTLQKKGVQRGDRVMLMVRPSMEFICLTYALFQLGAVVILIDPGMGYKNLLLCIGSVQPKVLIAIPQVHLFSRLFRKPFVTVERRFCVGTPLLGLCGTSMQGAACKAGTDFTAVSTQEDELAAIIFTTGSTGPPKGVQYTHGIFYHQLQQIRNYYGIGPDDVDQPGFPLFALFATALGAAAVIPDMDPTRPAEVDPAKFIRSIQDKQVSYSFGSPAIWNVVSRYCIDQHITLPVRKVLMAGAPVSGELIERMQRIMPEDGEVYTPYGATESLPSTSITGREILEETWAQTRIGKGTCVGRPLPGMRVKIIKPVDNPLADWNEVEVLSNGNIGEIVVKGPVVTQAYDHNEEETRMAKIPDAEGGGLWHRMGDMGYLDEQGRLWFCGRKAHRILTEDGPMYTICCEAIFNEHPEVFRSALVGLGEPGKQQPVLTVELYAKKPEDEKRLCAELQQLARSNPLTSSIEIFMIFSVFPVDIRHNAKIFREKLAVWVQQRMECRQGL
ncbi:Acyl-CoA synthetase (AMP-forming)/AMP-acid ligase II [Candidatus Electrothrix aarhusensis]|jgi:acyl-coenzyme A synthetase/AMP-(fatty) acid ligase|uniref:Acyl-CoA synthetase (AMP-forming)/AMP-acid ligase II n=1 Tax=Candidatus Electrothrix aarhusensis TaxID=1859131 RepID=A0A444IZ88_9BACT|nr:Acyl-CoA synthetase (AMP-forming)/AMP-acid ligase II [Candidatus Electrothrix aarhusensis]